MKRIVTMVVLLAVVAVAGLGHEVPYADWDELTVFVVEVHGPNEYSLQDAMPLRDARVEVIDANLYVLLSDQDRQEITNLVKTPGTMSESDLKAFLEANGVPGFLQKIIEQGSFLVQYLDIGMDILASMLCATTYQPHGLTIEAGVATFGIGGKVSAHFSVEQVCATFWKRYG